MNALRSLPMLGLALALGSCGWTQGTSDLRFHDAAIRRMSACLIAGRDCGIVGSVDVPRSEALRDACFGHIQGMMLHVSGHQAQFKLTCVAQQRRILLTATADRSLEKGVLEEPAVTIQVE